mmetsp:Transcript_12738/g.26837  ORF Transcript_12738/g.26837 Transcript_12738/m.26837 type:complete len:214 (-) Transcript_12738:495-1136(-)|eukprot:CAMPEP_0168231568 /NCGR_PEP_ID=MMETSP0140_2-20121125/16665_1 /TAXON_ID=44445 /ORGANISM="Pseudo-nitzschia australis, Strain 10249 10 AB" /LENGTH=213 /DNA_ID=CAMNT_0008164029 /DNA_START=462 /DNA_END=1103 /DNA_ORIENTATION=+
MNIQHNTTTKGSYTYAVDAFTATVDQVRTDMDTNIHNIHTIANTQDQLLAQPDPTYATHYVLSLVSASTSTTTPSDRVNRAMEQRLKKLYQMFQQFFQQQTTAAPGHLANSTNNPHFQPGPESSPTGSQWGLETMEILMYSSCGTNVNHNSINCHWTKLQLPEHNKFKATTTKDNSQGGNSTKDQLWMKWCHLVTYSAHDTKANEGMGARMTQ